MPIVIGEPHYRGKGIGRKVLSALVRRGRAEPLQPGAKAGNENNAKENVFMDEAITQKLFALQDETYQAFQSKLMPAVSPETIIGVRAHRCCGSLQRSSPERPGRKPFCAVCPTNTTRRITSMHFSWKTSGTMIGHWQKQRNSCLTLTIGPPVTAFAPRFLQSIKKNCW